MAGYGAHVLNITTLDICRQLLYIAYNKRLGPRTLTVVEVRGNMLLNGARQRSTEDRALALLLVDGRDNSLSRIVGRQVCHH